MKIFERFFKKEEEKADILQDARRDIAQKSFFEMNLLRTSPEEEATKIIDWCKVAQKKNDPSDHIDAAVVLMSYPAEFSFAILCEIKRLIKSQASVFEANLYEALGKIDVLYEENERIKDLKKNRAEVYYIFGKKPSFRINKAAQLLAVCIVSSESVQAARALYEKNEHFSDEVRKHLKEEIKKYDEKIVNEIIT